MKRRDPSPSNGFSYAIRGGALYRGYWLYGHWRVDRRQHGEWSPVSAIATETDGAVKCSNMDIHHRRIVDGTVRWV